MLLVLLNDQSINQSINQSVVIAVLTRTSLGNFFSRKDRTCASW